MQIIESHRTDKASLTVVYDRNEVVVNCYLTEDLAELVKVKFLDLRKAATAFTRLQGALELFKNYGNKAPTAPYLNAVIKDLLS